MKWLSVLFLVFCAAVALAQTPTPTSPNATPGLSVALDRWYIVRESVGKGIKKGAGVRFRATGFDTADAGMGSASTVPCTPAGDELTCENGIKAKALRADEVRVELGTIVLTLGPASAEEGKAFAKWVADTTPQQAACLAAAQCCGAAEGPLAQKCDIKKVLGDRSFAACTAGLTSLRTALTAKKLPIPTECR